jgi:dienelactone hydrolase
VVREEQHQQHLNELITDMVNLASTLRNVSLVFILVSSLPTSLFSQEKEDLRLFSMWDAWSNGPRMLPDYLNVEAFRYLDKRDSVIALLRTKNDWNARKGFAREAMLKAIGGLPEKTPLNAKITGTVKKDGFRIEKILFESMPGNYVPGCLFIPDGSNKKRPAILHVTGHSTAGFSIATYQRMILNLVKKGFIVFAIDPVGQGERLQYFDPVKGESIIADGPTREHTYAGLQCILTGNSLAKYLIWDGMRALDYLETRPEVDMKRIGITGRSGGGTQSAYISAFDERVLAAAPENYFTSHRRLLESRGPQDAEQNFHHWLVGGTSIEDLLVLRIPRPTLLVTTTRDIFSIQGVREMYPQILKGYAAFGAQADFQMVEDNAAHSSTKLNREATYRFFQKYLSLPGSPADEEVQILKREELYVTPSGQVATSIGGETVFSLNRAEADRLYKHINRSRQNKDHRELVKTKSMLLSGYRLPEQKADAVYRGSYQRDGYTIGMYALPGEGPYRIPLLLAVPDGEKTGHSPVIYIHPDGKEAGIAPGGPIERLVKEGYIVAAPDLSGVGELQPELRFLAEASFAAMLTGRSIVGIQAAEIVRVVNFLKELPGVGTDYVQAIAFSDECPALLHAAVFEPAIHNVALVNAPLSYYNITQSKMYDFSQSFNWGVPGALTAYDLPDLAACVAPRKLTFAALRNAMNEPASDEVITEQMGFATSVYARTAPGNLKIIPMKENEINQLITSWLEK